MASKMTSYFQADELLGQEVGKAISKERMPDFDFLRPLKPTIVFATYWRFAVERQEVYMRRVLGKQRPGVVILFSAPTNLPMPFVLLIE